jgi:hypothetical protein
MPSEFKKRAQGPEGPLYVIVATEEQKWVNQEFLWRMIASLPEAAEGLTQRRKGRRRRKEGRKGGKRRGDWETRGLFARKDTLVEIRWGP